MITVQVEMLCLMILIISIVMTILGLVNTKMFMIGQFLWAFAVSLMFYTSLH